jgi:hypothetical protein
VVDDVYLIARGYDAAGYLAFIGVHLVIMLTGLVSARHAVRDSAGAAPTRNSATMVQA